MSSGQHGQPIKSWPADGVSVAEAEDFLTPVNTATIWEN